MKKLLSNKTFVEVAATIIIFVVMIVIFYVISQCITGNIDISIKVN